MERRHLDDELQKLNTSLMKVATLTEEAIHKSIEALKNLDQEMARRVIEEDQLIDDLENEIGEHYIELLALFQPMAKDLRFLATAMSFTTELERIADLTVNISQRVMEIAAQGQGHIRPLVDTPRLAEAAKWMVKNAVNAFVRADERLAREVIIKDQEANHLRTVIIGELVNDYLVKDGTCAPRAVPLILVVRDLERICDQAKAIAQDVIYMVHARVVKHHPERLQEEGPE